jgi:hypothetical protein
VQLLCSDALAPLSAPPVLYTPPPPEFKFTSSTRIPHSTPTVPFVSRTPDHPVFRTEGRGRGRARSAVHWRGPRRTPPTVNLPGPCCQLGGWVRRLPPLSALRDQGDPLLLVELLEAAERTTSHLGRLRRAVYHGMMGG